MKIVVLDGHTLNPGDISWEEMRKLGDLTIYDRTGDEEIIPRSGNAEAILLNKTPVTAATLDALPELKYIGVLATGYNVVDIKAAAAKKIPVTNIPSYGTNAVSQMVFAHILEHCHHVGEHSHAVKSGKWTACMDYCFWDHPQIELAEKTMGIIGFGRIGRRVGVIASAFGMKVCAFDSNRTDPPDQISDFKWADLETLLKESDIVSLNCPLTSETEAVINRKTLGYMKKSAFLVNASRGALVKDQDLADALNEERIAGASLDVIGSIEPPESDNPLLSAKNCYITPHIAWATKEARLRLMQTAVENLKSYIQGSPQNVVNL